MRFEVDALLFDIDGTLVDSTPAVEQIWAVWGHRHGIDPAVILSVSHGRRTQDTVALFLAPPDIPAAVEELEQLERASLDDVVALPATRSLLSRLPSDRWAAVTSGSGTLMRARLAAADLPIPSVLVAADDVVEGKPSPEGYRKAAAALGADVDRCLVIEGAPAGIAAGRAAGAPTIAVATSHDRRDLRDADVVLDDLTQLSIEVTARAIVVAADGDETGRRPN